MVVLLAPVAGAAQWTQILDAMHQPVLNLAIFCCLLGYSVVDVDAAELKSFIAVHALVCFRGVVAAVWVS